MMSRTTRSSMRAVMAGLLLAASVGLNQLGAQQATRMLPLSDPLVTDLQLETPVAPVAADSTFGITSDVLNAEYAEYVVPCDSCGDSGCDSCCPVPGRSTYGLWVRADYLLWWEKETDLPVLATTSTGNPPPADIGVLGLPTTEILFAGPVDDNALNGFRIELGTWLDAGYNIGVFGRYFTAGDREVSFSAGPNDFNSLARPFFNLALDAEDALLLTVPGERDGSMDIKYDGSIDGWEVLIRSCAQVGNNYRIDYVLGYRQMELDESLVINTTSIILPTSPVGIQGEVTTTNDVFRTKNEFHGFDIGLTGHSHDGCWTLDFMAKVALGNMRQLSEIQGSQLVVVPSAAPATLVGGLLSQETNIGVFEEDEFAWIPELNINFGYVISPCLDFTIGYSLIYISDMLHPGLTIDRVIDPALIVDLVPLNGNRPQPVRDERDHWLQGLNFGWTARF